MYRGEIYVFLNEITIRWVLNIKINVFISVGGFKGCLYSELDNNNWEQAFSSHNTSKGHR